MSVHWYAESTHMRVWLLLNITICLHHHFHHQDAMSISIIICVIAIITTLLFAWF